MTSDWALPHGVLLVQGGPNVRTRELCRHITSDFGAAFVVAGDGFERTGAHGVAEAWANAAERQDTCFVHESMRVSTVRAAAPRARALCVT